MSGGAGEGPGPASSRNPYRFHRRASGAGAHQAQGPISRIVAGTSRPRTTVASTAMAMTRPTPIIFMNTIDEVTNPETTMIISSATPVMIRPVRWSPTATASVSPTPRSHCSRTRDSRNTS